MISRIEATREFTWSYKSYRVSCYSVADASRLNPEHGDTGIAIYTSVLGSDHRWKAKGIYKITDQESADFEENMGELEKRNAHYFARLIDQNDETNENIVCFVEDELAKELLDAIEENQKEILQHIDCETQYYKKWKKQTKAEANLDYSMALIFLETQGKIIMM